MLSAMLMKVSLEEAQGMISRVRNVVWDDTKYPGEQWMHSMLREEITRVAAPTGFSCRTSNPDEVVVHATTVVRGGTEPICRWKKGAAGRQDFRRDSVTTESVEEAASQLGGRFCINCERLLRASLKLQVEEFYG